MSAWSRARSLAGTLFALAALAGCSGDAPTDPGDPDPAPQPNPTPAIAGVTPASALAGTDGLVVSIQGTGFIASTTARWNGAARETVVASATRLEMTLTAADLATPGSAVVSVYTPPPGGGTAQGATFVVEVPRNPLPVITSITPGLAYAGTGELEVEVRGQGFIPGSRVLWEGAERATNFVDEGELRAALSAEDVSEAGEFEVVVENPEPGGGRSEPHGFEVMVLPEVEPRSRIGSGSNFACALNPSGEAFCWGANGYAQLGNGLGPDVLTPQPVSGGHIFDVLAVGLQYVCGVTTDAALYCWGANHNGTIGNGTRQYQPYPQRIDPGRSWAWVTAASAHTCGLTTDGEAFCWGAGWMGKLGIGTIQDPTRPTAVVGGHRFRQIVAGPEHTCAITVEGEAWCWGNRASGRTGSGITSGSVASPEAVVTDERFAVISAGTSHSCALTAEGSAWCWGSAANGALGTGGFGTEPTPVPVAGGHRFQGLFTGARTNCATVAAGPTLCWGSGASGRTGRGDEADSRTPQPLLGELSLVDVALGAPVCGLDPGGAVWCWGAGEDAGVGEGSRTTRHLPEPVHTSMDFVEFDAGGTLSCGLTEAGAPWCWGHTLPGPLPTGSWSPNFAPVPTGIAGAPALHGITVGSEHVCALDGDGAAWCWGAGGAGRLGTGETSRSDVPLQVQGDVRFQRLSAGEAHTCGIDTDDHIWCWGRGSLGRLGTGEQTDEHVPVPVHSTVRFARITAGASHTCALTTGGEAWCWGSTGPWEVDGEGGPRFVPTPLATQLRFRTLSAGSRWNCGITSAPGAGLDEGPGTPLGDLYCWGDNTANRTGTVTPITQGVRVPTRVPTNLRFTRIETGSGLHGCAVNPSGVPYCWGRNWYGELGRDPRSSSSNDHVPQTVPGLANVIRIVPADDHVCAMTEGGQVSCWGRRLRGRLGDGYWGFTVTPVQIGVPW